MEDKTRKCQGCKKELPLDHFDPNKNLTRCNKCVAKYLKKDNNLWSHYPEIADIVNPKFKEEHPKITTVSKMLIDIPCPKCETIFSISPCDLLQTGFTPCCNHYLISLDKKELKNATIDTIVETKSYQEYAEKISMFKTVELGYIQEVFAFLYFNVHANLFDIDQYISYSLTKDKSILETLNLPKTDQGTDAVIIHRDKQISLVQVKWRSYQTCHGRSVFDGLAIDSQACSETVKHLILFSNSINIAKNLPTGEKFKYILYNNLLEIDWDFFRASVQNYKETKQLIPIPQSIVYRPWQIEASQFVKDKDIATIVAACGTGKTLCAYKIISKMSNYKVLIIVPSLQLLSQWFYAFATHCGKDTEFLLVGSDHDSDIVDVPFTLTTDFITVTDVMENAEKKFITICTYQSLNIVYDRKFDFDITFADEAHLTTGITKGNYTLIHKKDFTTKRKIFLTATPKIYKGLKTQICVSMDDKTKYGEHFIYSCRQAIEDNFLTEYKVLLGRYNGKFSDKNRYKKYAHYLIKCIEEYNLKRILVASNNHTSSAKLYNIFKEIYKGSLQLVLMKNKACAQDRNKILAEIVNTPMIIFNVKIFNLGIDIPSLEAVMFNDDKKSHIDIVQTAMRCLRKNAGKKISYILVPAFLGETLKASQNDDFHMIRNTLSALGDQDTEIFEEILLRVKNARSGQKYSNNKQHIEYVNITEEEEMDFNKIELRLFDRMGNISRIAWNIKYEQLKERNEIPKQSEELGKWVSKQRQAKKKGLLSQDQIKLLEQLSFWKWNLFSYLWKKHYDELKILNKMPKKSEELGKWVSVQQQLKRKNKLSEEKIELLEQLSFWIWDKLDHIWKKHYYELKKFNKMPKRSDPLGIWVTEQRKMKDRLSQEKIDLLEQLSFWSWNILEDAWGKKYEELKKLNCLPQKYTSLYNWVLHQRENKRKNKLSQIRINLLEQLSFWIWDGRKKN